MAIQIMCRRANMITSGNSTIRKAREPGFDAYKAGEPPRVLSCVAAHKEAVVPLAVVAARRLLDHQRR
jgi:hypothetical protein